MNLFQIQLCFDISISSFKDSFKIVNINKIINIIQYFKWKKYNILKVKYYQIVAIIDYELKEFEKLVFDKIIFFKKKKKLKF